MKRVSLFFSLGVILLLSLFALRSLISNPFYTSHDGFTHVARIMAYYEALKDGQFPPRWATKFSGNLGSPIFVYSYPLPYFLGAALHFGGVHYQDAFRWVIGGGYLLSGFAAFWWLSKRFGKSAGLVGAVFYIFAPYRFLNIYVRGAFAESLAYTFIPLIILAIEQLFEKKEKYWRYILAFATAGLLLSHNVVAAMLLPIVVVLVLLFGVVYKNLKKVIICLASLVGGFLMSIFIYGPDLLERNYIRFDQGISYWQNYFVAWWQLIRSRWGYGFDFPGTSADDMSFQLGLSQMFVVAILIALIVILVLVRRYKWKSRVNIEGIFFLIVLAIAIFMMIDEPLIIPLWKMIPLVKTIVDFPWRFLGVTVVAFSFLAAYLVYLARSSRLLVIGLLIVVVYANRNFIRINQPQYFSDKTIEGYHGTSTAGSNEYNTVWHVGDSFPGDLEIPGVVNRATGMDITVEQKTNDFMIYRFYFPETNIYYKGNKLIENQDYDVIRQQQFKQFDDTGLIRLRVAEPGIYHLRFGETLLRKVANSISLLTFGILIIFGFREFIMRRR